MLLSRSESWSLGLEESGSESESSTNGERRGGVGALSIEGVEEWIY